GSRRGLRLPAIQLPRLRWPLMSLPTLRVSCLPLPGWASPRRRLLEIWRAIGRACRSSASAPTILSQATPLPPEPLAVQVARSTRASSEQMELARSNMPAGDTAQEVWSADDRVQAVAAALAAIWEHGGLSNSVLALDTETRDGPGQVAVMIDAAPADEA